MTTKTRLEDLWSPELKPYLTYSIGVHFAVALLAWQVVAWKGTSGKSTVYSIDFVGGPANIITSAGTPSTAQTPAASKPAASKEFDEFGRRKKGAPLPKPSLLRNYKEPKEQPAAETPKTTGESSGEAGPGGDAGVAADMPNFPYPWYISRVRQMLWNMWQSRMPRGPGECVVVFSLMPNGTVVDLRTETSSGDSAFDIAALAAVQDAAPYPPLPSGFTEPFLKIHVTLKSR